MTEPGPAGNPAEAPPNLAAFDARFTRLEDPLQQSPKVVDAGLAAREAQDRSWIARAILWVFVISVGIVLVIFLAEGILTSKWDQVALQAADLIKSSVLPVVTLVLGFYFGSRSGRG